MVAHHRIGVFTVGQGHDAHGNVGGHQQLQRVASRSAASAIAVVTKHNFAGQPAQLLDLFGGQCSAKWRDGFGDAGLMQGNYVKVAFDQDRAIFASHGFARLRQAKQQPRFFVHRRFRRVDVLRRFAAIGIDWLRWRTADDARRKADNFATWHDYGAHQAIAVAIVKAACALLACDQAQAHGEFDVELFGLDVVGELMPVVGAVAELKLFDDGSIAAAFVEIRAPGRAALRMRQRFAEECRGCTIEIEHR